MFTFGAAGHSPARTITGTIYCTVAMLVLVLVVVNRDKYKHKRGQRAEILSPTENQSNCEPWNYSIKKIRNLITVFKLKY